MISQELNLTDAVVFRREVQLQITRSAESLSLFIVDMGGIKKIFSRKNPEISRSFLSNIARLLQRLCREQDRLYRIGDFTFGIALADVSSDVHIQLAAEKIVRLHDTAIRDLDVPYKAKVFIGIAKSPEDSAEAHELIRKAGVALEASRSSDDPYFVYRPDAVETLSLKWNLQEEVGAGITARDFSLYYQPKISLSTGRVVGAEALLRWASDSHGSVRPDIFIAIAREIGRMNELTQSLLTTALRQVSEWPRREDADYGVSVNLDADSLKDPDIADVIESSLSIWGGNDHQLTIEITEAALVTESDSNFAILHKLRSMGIGISIDDFGTGYSALSYFKRIPASELKIDQAFVKHMLESDGDRSIVETIIELAHRFDMQVVAEGVETAEQLEMLKKLGCDTAQGFYFSEPLPQDEYCRWLKKTDFA
ncbi:MAG: GGDEF domain-containing protein [Chromatiales bacterium]|nr:MAG: GGDEF domain-containing protein [Chromatiales bacterium]